MSKFTGIITKGSEGILSGRAKNLAEQAKLMQERLVSDKKGKVLEIEQKLNALTDIAPDSTTSLHPGGSGKGFDAKQWVDQLHALKLAEVEAKLELEIATKTLIEQTCPLLTERGIAAGERYNVINEGPSDQRKKSNGGYFHTYLIKGTQGTPIVVYEDEVHVITE